MVLFNSFWSLPAVVVLFVVCFTPYTNRCKSSDVILELSHVFNDRLTQQWGKWRNTAPAHWNTHTQVGSHLAEGIALTGQLVLPPCHAMGLCLLDTDHVTSTVLVLYSETNCDLVYLCIVCFVWYPVRDKYICILKSICSQCLTSRFLRQSEFVWTTKQI